jgi:phosphatidylglycerol:prolipoprotein diacylglycerol transferase
VHPYLFHFGQIFLPTFGVLAAVGLVAALVLGEKTAALAGVGPEALWDAGLFAVLAAFVLSRLLLLGSYWRSFVAFPLLILAVPSLTAAGLLLTAAATLAWLWWKNIPILRALDAWAPCATLVWFFLALGHFAEGSDPGLPTTLPFGVRMPGEATPLHPVALYAAVVAGILTVLLYMRLRRALRAGETAGVALSAVGLAQFLLSFVRQPGQQLQGLDMLQWVALAMLVVGGSLLAMREK